MKSLAFGFTLTLVAAAALAAQATTPGPLPAQAAGAPTAAPDLPSPPADFTYSPSGRRDPFTSLATPRGAVTVSTAGLTKGAAGIPVDELNVKGIVLSNGVYVAMVSGPGGKTQTYTVKAGSRLFDGTVQSITADALVILQQVSDPLSLEKQRRVRKPLRTQEEGK